jgi:LAO/AO transport system kinase
MGKKVDELLDAIQQKNVRLTAKLITLAEDGSSNILPTMRELYRHVGNAMIIGLTGPTGVGKSCLVDRLISAYRRAGKFVAVIAVDPSSAQTGGAILGDRIRMQEHAGDPAVFIRSMASRHHVGGLAAATGDALTILDAAGWDVILVETVGIGQTEIEVARTVQTCVLVLAPNTGDDMQRMKCGIMEVADIFVVNKADMGGADLVTGDLQRSLGSPASEWNRKKVVACSALRSEGIEDLVAAVGEHHEHLREHGLLGQMLERRIADQILSIAQSRIGTMLAPVLGSSSTLEHYVERVLKGEADPVSAGEEIAQLVLAGRW